MDEDTPPQWFTEARQEHEAALTVGQRVRIDIGECPHLLRWHGTVEQGVTGIIISIEAISSGHPSDHIYTVYFDRPIRTRMTWDYAACELAPVPWPTPEEIVRETLARLKEHASPGDR